MRTAMRLAILAVACLAAMNAHVAFASDVPLADDALLYNDVDGHLASAQKQRSLLQYGAAPPPYYCANSHIRPVFTVKIAVLVVGGSKGYKTVTAGDYVGLIKPRLEKRFNRYNRRYKLSLGYTITQLNSGSVKKGQQKWFYYDIKFIVGTCGLYKFPLITQLRGEIQPSAPFIKRNRVLLYPFRA